MQISFHPELGETVRVSLPPCAAPVQLRFTATFASQDDYEDYKRAGAMVELWSNIADNDHWAGQTFIPVMPTQKVDSARCPTRNLSLVSEGGNYNDLEATTSENTLVLWVSAPFTGKDVFEYTFRLVYPSHIAWLGHARNNGRVILDKSNPTLTMRTGWSSPSPSAHVGSALYEAQGKLLDRIEVARLNLAIGRDCAVWALGRDGSVFFVSAVLENTDWIPDNRWVDGALTPVMDISLVFVVPCAKSITLPPIFALSALAGSSISLDSRGGFGFTGSGECSLLLQTHELGSDPKPFINSVLSHADRSTHFQLLSCRADSGAFVLASSKHIFPGSALIIPLPQNPSAISVVRMDAHLLAASLPFSSRFALFIPATMRASFFDAVPESLASETVSFTTSTMGGYLTIGPVHNLGGEDSPWDVSVLTSYVPTPNPDHVLPTPPASPTLRPSILQQHAESSSTSVPSITDAGISLTTLHTSATTAKPVQRRATQGLVLRFVKYNLAIVLAFLRMLLQLSFGSFFARKALGTRETTSGPREVTSTAKSDAEIQSDTSDHHPESPTQSVALQVFNTLETCSNSTPLLVNTCGGNVSMLLRSRRENASVDEVVVQCDGAVAYPKIKEIERGLFLAELDGVAFGGQVKVFLR
jgi:hypothetical protein